MITMLALAAALTAAPSDTIALRSSADCPVFLDAKADGSEAMFLCDVQAAPTPGVFGFLARLTTGDRVLMAIGVIDCRDHTVSGPIAGSLYEMGTGGFTLLGNYTTPDDEIVWFSGAGRDPAPRKLLNAACR